MTRFEAAGAVPIRLIAKIDRRRCNVLPPNGVDRRVVRVEDESMTLALQFSRLHEADMDRSADSRGPRSE
jgi:hypothetical protein